MADDFNDWIDGEPITGPSSDGSFTEWIDGEPVIRYEDSATDLVIPDADHLHDADAADLTTFWQTDFSEYTTGIAPDGDAWPEELNAAIGTHIVRADGDLGGKCLELANSLGDRYFCSYGAAGSLTDVEVLAKVRITAAYDHTGRIAIRGGGAAGNEQVYFCGIQPTADSVFIHKYTPTSTSVGTASKTIDQDTWYWIRFQAIGTALKLRVWEDGTSEPGTWDVSQTDSSLSSGWVGVGSYNTGADIDYYACSNDGSTVPMPAVATTDLVIPDAYHLHDAENLTITQVATIWDEFTYSSFTTFIRSYRQVLANADIVDPGFTVGRVRVCLEKTRSYSYGVTGLSIGLRSGSTEDYQSGKFVRLTFNDGDNDVEVSSAADVWSDWVDFGDFDPDADLLVCTDTAQVGAGYQATYSSGGTAYRKDGELSDCMVADVSGYSEASYTYIIKAVEVEQGSANTALVIPDAAHLHAAERPELIHAATVYSVLAVYNGESANRSYRNEINDLYISPATGISNPYLVRVFFKGPAAGTYTVTGASVGLQVGSTEDYQVNKYVRLTFNGGSHSAEIGTDGLWTDWVNWAYFSASANTQIHLDTSTDNVPYFNQYYTERRDGSHSDAMVADLDPLEYYGISYSYGSAIMQIGATTAEFVIPEAATHLHDAENLTITTDAATDLVIPDAYHLVIDTNRAIEIVPAEDTYLDQRATTTPRGADTFCMNKNYTGYQRYSLLRIDLGDIPVAADITNVTLKTYQASIDVDPDSITLNIYKCLKAWVENEATWNVYSTGNSWDTAGALNSTTDYDGATLFSTITCSTPDPGANTLWEFPTSDNFVNYIDSVIGGEANLIVHADYSQYGLYTFHSKESATSAYWPVLYVRYTDATPLALTQTHDLVVAEAYNELVDEGPITIQTGLTLVLAESYHDLVDEGPLALTQAHALAVAECDHLHEADSIVLTALHLLTVAECYHVHAPPNLTLTTLTALTVQESHHLHDADNITLTGDITLSDLDSNHLHEADNIVLGYTETLQDLDSYHLHDADAAILECGQILWLHNNTDPSDDTDYAYGDRNYRQYWSAAKAFPNHGFIRFMIKSQPSFGVDLDHMSVGVRSGTTDDYASAPTEVTFNSGALDVSLTANDWIWSDWISFTAADGEYLLTSIWDEGGHISVWVDAQPIYQDSGVVDRTMIQTVTMSGTPNSRFIAGIQVKPATVTALTVSEPYHLHVADSIATLNIEITSIDSAYHLHDADQADILEEYLKPADSAHALTSDTVDLALTAWVNPNPWTYDTSAAARNYRMIMPAAILDYEGQYVRVKIECHDTDSVSMDGMSIGRRKAAADAFDYDDSTVTPVRFTFDGGSNDVVVGAGESKWSDWVPFSLNPSLDHLIHCHLNGPHKFSYNTVLDCYRKNASTDETMISDVKSYTLVDEFFYLVKVEVRVRSVMAGFDDAVHLHTADNLALGVHLTVADSAHLHEADALTLTGTHNLTLAACDHLHDADALTLTQDHALALDDADHLHDADTLNLAGTNILVVADADHLHTADAADLIVTLAVDESDHLHTAPNLTIVSGFDLVIPETVILTVSDNIAGMTVSMTVASSYHDHLADALAITATHYLTVAETYHLHTAESLNTYMTGDLPIQSAHHEIESDELTLGFSVTLTVREAYHRHFVDTLALTQEHTLAMPDGDSYHDHFADNIEIPALPEGLERTFINSLTVQRTMWSLTQRLTIEGRAA